jgi:hypothetical protein
MKIHVVVREDQSDLGYIDTSILGVYRDRDAALVREHREVQDAHRQGFLVEGDPEVADGEWQVSISVSEHDLD